MKSENLQKYTFSAYETGITTPTVGSQYTLNGKHNENFKRYKDAYEDSPTNNFIIKNTVNYIIGNGLVDRAGSINIKDYLSSQDLRLICLDFKTYGSAFVQIISFDNKIIKLKHTPVMSVGLNIARDMEVNGYWYCWDFSKPYQFKPRFIPKFGEDSGITIAHIRQVSSDPFFSLPDWFSGLKSAKTEAALIDDAVNHVLRGFQGKTIINVNTGESYLPEEKKEMTRKFKEEATGTQNSDGVFVSINENTGDSLVIDTIEPRGRNEQFVTYDETAEIKLMAAHGAMNILFQRPGSSGFSNNADEIKMATESYYLSTINPMREIILDVLNNIFKKIDPKCDIDFENFGSEKALASTPTDDAIDLKAKYQIELCATVGGATLVLDIQKSYLAKTTSFESAIAMFMQFYGKTREEAIHLLGNPVEDPILTQQQIIPNE